MKPLKVNFNFILLDFIIRLPKFKDLIIRLFYNILIIIINRFLKYIKLFYINKTIITRQFTYLLLLRVFLNHGFPNAIILDKNKLFTLNFWQKIIKAL